MPAIAVTDHGNTFAAFEFYKTATRCRHQADHRHRGVRHARHAPRDKARVRWGRPDQNDDDVSGSGAYTHMTLLAESDRGHAQPLPAVVVRARMEGYYFKPRMDRELLQTYSQGPDRDDRLPSAARCRRGCGSASTTRRKAAAAEFRDIFGKENYFAEIMDHGYRIERRVMSDLLRARERARHPAGRHERPALHAPARCEEPRGAAVRAVRLDAR